MSRTENVSILIKAMVWMVSSMLLDIFSLYHMLCISHDDIYDVARASRMFLAHDIGSAGFDDERRTVVAAEDLPSGPLIIMPIVHGLRYLGRASCNFVSRIRQD